jgi:diguanylate cyclase (GGDEF)-like protein/PAS domain S-box-containing protein
MSDYIAGETDIYLVEYRLRCKDNFYKWILGRGMVVKRSEDGKPLRMIGTHVDLTERKVAEEELFLQKEYLKAIFDNEPECVKVFSIDGQLLDMNAAGLKMFEVDSIEEVRQVGFLGFVATEYRDAYAAFHKQVIAGHSGAFEFSIKGRKGGIRWLETHATPLRDKQGCVISFLGVARDVTEHKQFRQALEQQAHFDFLTGIYNRGFFMQLAELELARTARYGNSLSVFMMDIDYFKQINDTHGHKVGDLVLKKLAALCKEILREVDIFGRIGGEEFAILLPETEANESGEVAERLRAEIETTKVQIENGLPINFSVSIGVTSIFDRNENIDVLLDRADKALYIAKNAGRNQVYVIKPCQDLT